MTTRERLVRLLADGDLHSGAALAAQLGVSRSAVWKQANRLRGMGLDLRASAGGGYRLARPLTLLDRAMILAALDEPARSGCEWLEVRAVTGSTSADLLALPAPKPGHWQAALAEYQTGGRGRRGRRWLSSFAGGLCMSVGWTYPAAPRDLPALSLAVGIAVHRAIAGAGAAGAMLKWPNDVVCEAGKVGGILVDVEGDSRGPLRAVVGVGLNLVVPQSLCRSVVAEGGLPPAALEDLGLSRTMARNSLAARIIRGLLEVLRDYAEVGFAPLADEWRRSDFLYGKAISVSSNGQHICGTAHGIAADGALLVERPEGIAAVFNGDVTVRGAP